MFAAFDERSIIAQLDDRLRHVATTADRNHVIITLPLAVLLQGGSVYKALMIQRAHELQPRKVIESDIDEEMLVLLAKSLSEIDGYQQKGVTFNYSPESHEFTITRPSGARRVE